jgi:peptidyl-prolyl cis-trans isomerase D
MGMMARMRNLAPWFIISVGGIFILYMALMDTKVMEIFGARSNNVGSVNGRDITYQEYAAAIERYRENQQRQGMQVDDNQMESIREQTWEALVTQILLEQKIEEFGIKVTDQEIVDVVTGPNPPQFLTQYFTDSLGRFNREAYDAAIRDRRNSTAMVQAEEVLRQQLLQEKLQNYVLGTINVSENEIRRQFADQTINITADYVFVDIGKMSDKEITFNDSDLKAYYDKHLNEYKVEAQRKIKYVLFRIAPSKDDTNAVVKNLQAILKKSEDEKIPFKQLIQDYSTQPYKVDTTNISMLPPNVIAALAKASAGQIVGPIVSWEGFTLYNVVAKITESQRTAVKASHILIPFDPANGGEEAALKTATELYDRLVKGEDFGKLAREYSKDPGSAANGGDLGWFGRQRMVKEFEDACFSGAINQIQKPVKTSYGYHIIKVTDASNDKVVLEKLVNKIETSASTSDKIYNDANDFSYIANENGFDKEAKMLKYKVIESGAFTEEAGVIPGLGLNRSLIKFIFNGSIGDISEVYKVAAGYVVCTITSSEKAGFRPFEELKETIKSQVIREKKVEKAMKIAADLKKKINGDFNAAYNVYPQATVALGVTFTPGGTIPSLGREYGLLNYGVDGKVGVISDPVKGTRGAFIVKITNRTQFDENAYAVQRNIIRDNLIQFRKQRLISEWMQKIRKEADIEDNRYKFYR